MSNPVENLEFWMTKLPQCLRHIPIIYLAIPGSHDSTTFAITTKSKIAPDARNPIQYLKFLERFLAPIMFKWSKTQSVNIAQQLNIGIRYFDLRIATKAASQGFYFVHNLYSQSVEDVLDDAVSFLDAHPKEIVILDCQHFFRFTPTDHEKFVSMLIAKLGRKLLPFTSSLAGVSLEYMAKFQYQVVLVYRCASVKFEKFWPSACFPTPWPNTVSVSKLITCLDTNLKTRNSSLGYISQCVLTPNLWFVCRYLFSSLENKCVLPLENYKYDWIKNQKPGVGGINIIISDFVEYQNCQFSKEVVSLNLKLLDNSYDVMTKLE